MQVPLQITARNVTIADDLDEYIRQRAAKLDEISDTIISCRVVLEEPHKHKQKGRLYHVSLELNIPGDTIVVSREPDLHDAHQDKHVVIRDAFDAAQRQLRSSIDQIKGQVKAHEETPVGKIAALFPLEDYGRIMGADGAYVYFHRNSVKGKEFNELEEGMRVAYSQEEGNDGPQAVWVRVAE